MDGTLRYIPGELEGSTCTAGIEEINGGPAGQHKLAKHHCLIKMSPLKFPLKALRAHAARFFFLLL